jgi:hypothetical protein
MSDPDERGMERTLDEVGHAIEGCLTTLDRYEVRFAQLLAECDVPPGLRPREERVFPALAKHTGWNERLAAAQSGADEVEQLLAEQEAVWDRWQEAFSAWRRLVEQPAEPAAESGA